MHLWTKCTLLTVPQPPHGPLVASLTLWSSQCLCHSMFASDVKTAKSHSFPINSSSTPPPRNEGAPTHSCHWPGWPHRATESQRRPTLFSGVWGNSLAASLCPYDIICHDINVLSVVLKWNFCVYSPMIPYACILKDYEAFFHRFLLSLYTTITNPYRKPEFTLNTARCFFTKQAGGKLFKQSLRVLMVPSRILFCRRSLLCNSVRDYLLSVFLHQKGSEFAFKVAHCSWFMDKVRPDEEERHPWI